MIHWFRQFATINFLPMQILKLINSEQLAKRERLFGQPSEAPSWAVWASTVQSISWPADTKRLGYVCVRRRLETSLINYKMSFKPWHNIKLAKRMLFQALSPWLTTPNNTAKCCRNVGASLGCYVRPQEQLAKFTGTPFRAHNQPTEAASYGSPSELFLPYRWSATWGQHAGRTRPDIPNRILSNSTLARWRAKIDKQILYDSSQMMATHNCSRQNYVSCLHFGPSHSQTSNLLPSSYSVLAVGRFFVYPLSCVNRLAWWRPRVPKQ